MDQTVFLISLLTPVIVVLLTTFATFLFEMMCTIIVPTDTFILSVQNRPMRGITATAKTDASKTIICFKCKPSLPELITNYQSVTIIFLFSSRMIR